MLFLGLWAWDFIKAGEREVVKEHGKRENEKWKLKVELGMKPLMGLKAGFHKRRSRSRNQKRRPHDLVKTGFRFRWRLRRLRSAYDLVKTRSSESEAEAEG